MSILTRFGDLILAALAPFLETRESVQRRIQHHSPVTQALVADRPVFEDAKHVEIRPGRSLNLLHVRGHCASAGAGSEGVRTRRHSNSPEDAQEVVLFFVHGSMGHMQQFDEQVTHFVGRGYSVVAFDAFGCGGSPKPRDWDAYSHAEMLADLKAIYQRYKGAKNILVAHSYGASMAMQLSEAMGEGGGGICGLVLIGACFGPDHYPKGSLKLFKNPLFFLQLAAPILRRGFIHRAVHPATLERQTETHQRLVQRILDRAGSNPMHVCQAFYRQMKWADADTAARVSQDVLLITGEGDKLTPPKWAAQLTDIFRQQRPERAAELAILSNSSHQVMQELPVEVNALIESFIAKALVPRRDV